MRCGWLISNCRNVKLYCGLIAIRFRSVGDADMSSLSVSEASHRT